MFIERTKQPLFEQEVTVQDLESQHGNEGHMNVPGPVRSCQQNEQRSNQRHAPILEPRRFTGKAIDDALDQLEVLELGLHGVGTACGSSQ